MTVAEDLIRKAESREALFGIVGLGYVGLPLAVELAKAGYRVLGYDVSARVVDGLNAGRSHIKDVHDDEFAAVVAALSLIHISEPTRLLSISYAVFCLKK